MKLRPDLWFAAVLLGPVRMAAERDEAVDRACREASLRQAQQGTIDDLRRQLDEAIAERERARDSAARWMSLPGVEDRLFEEGQ